MSGEYNEVLYKYILFKENYLSNRNFVLSGNQRTAPI